MNKEHELKCLPEYYQAVKSGEKSFEIRYNDRDYQIGDTLIIKEWDNEQQQFTGDEVTRTIKYMTNFEQGPGFVVLGIQPEPYAYEALEQLVEDYKRRIKNANKLLEDPNTVMSQRRRTQGKLETYRLIVQDLEAARSVSRADGDDVRRKAILNLLKEESSQWKDPEQHKIKYAIKLGNEYMRERYGSDCFTDDLGQAIIFDRERAAYEALVAGEMRVVEIIEDEEGGLEESPHAP